MTFETILMVYFALGISSFIMGMAPHWRELIEAHIETPARSLVADVIVLFECLVAWPYFMYHELFGKPDNENME